MKRIRWTVLDIDEDTISLIKKYAKDNGYTTAKALSVLVKKGVE